MLWPCGPCVAHSTLRVPVKAGTVSHGVPAFTAYRRRPLGAVQAGTPVPALANFCHRRPLSLGSRRLAQNRPVQGQQAFGRWRGRGAAVHGVLTPAVHGRTLEQPFRDADGRCCSYAWLSLVFVWVCGCHACVWIRDGASPHLDTALCNLCSPTTHWSNVHKRCTFDQWVVGENNARLGVRTQLTQIRTLCACLCPASPSWSTQPAASCSKQWVRRRREGVTRRGGGA